MKSIFKNNKTSNMKQLTLGKAILYHLYPGIMITLAYILLTPLFVLNHYPPQLSFLLCILFVGLPVFLLHLRGVKKSERAKSIWSVNKESGRLSNGKLVFYAVALVVFAYIVWGTTQSLN